MKLLKYLFLGLYCFSLFNCPDKDEFNPDSTLIIINNSAESVVEYREYSELEDTTLQVSSPFTSQKIINVSEILPGARIEIPQESEAIKRLGVMHLYLINKDTLEQAPWQRIRDEYLILRRYDLTLEDLEALDWTVEYP